MSVVNAKTFENLDSVAPLLAELYKTAGELLDQFDPDSADARVTLSLICHSMRELINAVPESFPYEGDIPQRNGNQNQELEQYIFAAERASISNVCVPNDETAIPLPGFFVKAAKNYYSQHKGHTDIAAARRAISATLNGVLQPGLLAAWRKASNFFQSKAHIKPGMTNELPPVSEVESHYKTVEGVLDLKVGLFFSVKAELNDCLVKANSQLNNEYLEPDRDEVLYALARLGDVYLKSFFYSSLNNPLWVRPLYDNSAFTIIASPGNGLYRQWPEGHYLSRMAKFVPDRVVEVFSMIDKWDNPYVIESAINSLGDMPAKNACAIIKQLSSTLTNQKPLNSFLWANESLFAALINALAGSNSQRQTAENFIKECFMPRSAGSQPFSDPIACIDSYHYGKRILEIAPYVSNRYLISMLTTFLAEYELAKFGERWSSSSLWVASVEDEVDASSESMLSSLISAMAYAFDRALQTNFESFNNTALQSNDTLLRRIAIYVLGKSLQYALNSGQAVPEDVETVTEELLGSQIIFDYDFDPELYPLIRIAVANGFNLSNVWEVISRDNSEYEQYRRLQAASQGLTGDSAYDEAHQSALFWKYRALSLIGKNLLPDSLVRELSLYVEEYGEVVFSEKHVYSSSTWVGPTSPIALDEMQLLEPHTLLNHLIEWHADKAKFDTPSHEGQGRLLSELVENDPSVFAGHLDLMLRLRPTYIREILNGWTKALTKSEEIPLYDALAVINQIVNGSLPINFEPEGDSFDDDPDYKNAQLQCARFIETLIEKECDCLESSVLSQSLLDHLTQLVHLDCFVEDDEDRWLSEGSDAFTASINTQRSIALSGIVKLAGTTPDADTSKQALDYLLSYLPNNSPSLSDAAAIGGAIGALLSNHFDWVKLHLKDIYGESEPNLRQKTCLSVTLTAYHPNRLLTEILGKPIVAALKTGAASYPIGWKIGQGNTEISICDWILSGIVNGYIERNDTLGLAWQTHTSPETKRQSINQLCWKVAHSNSISANVINRIVSFIDYCFDFESDSCAIVPSVSVALLAKSGFFEERWWAERFVAASKADPDTHSIYVGRDAVVKLSNRQPGLALDIFESCIANAESQDIHTWEIQEAAIPILGNSIIAKGDIEARARKCADKLGFLGMTDLDEKLSQYASQ